MRRHSIHFAAWILCALAAWTAQAAQLSLPRPFGVQGSTLSLPVLCLSQADSVSTLQFDLEYDSSRLTLMPVPGEAARAAVKTVSSADLAPNRKRILIAGLNQTPLPDGPVLNLFVGIAPDAPDGVYTVHFSGVVASDANAQPLLPDSVDGAITVYQALGSPAPIQPASVLNGASLLPGPLAPGELIRVVGPPPDASLSFAGTPAPLLPAPPNQIAVIVPTTLTGSSTRLQLLSQGQLVTDVLLPLAPTSPAIFTASGDGTGQGAILNEDLTPNSALNPAPRGSIITILATGLGQSDDGLSVNAGPDACPILYVEPPDAFNPGVSRIKCTVPVNAAVGYTIPVFLYSVQTRSQVGVTIALE